MGLRSHPPPPPDVIEKVISVLGSFPKAEGSVAALTLQNQFHGVIFLRTLITPANPSAEATAVARGAAAALADSVSGYRRITDMVRSEKEQVGFEAARTVSSNKQHNLYQRKKERVGKGVVFMIPFSSFVIQVVALLSHKDVAWKLLGGCGGGGGGNVAAMLDTLRLVCMLAGSKHYLLHCEAARFLGEASKNDFLTELCLLEKKDDGTDGKGGDDDRGSDNAGTAKEDGDYETLTFSDLRQLKLSSGSCPFLQCKCAKEKDIKKKGFLHFHHRIYTQDWHWCSLWSSVS